mgnify:CR=1 FL=1
MKTYRSFSPSALAVVLLLSLIGCLLLATQPAPSAGQQATPADREALYRRNNLGVAWMEQFKHEEAVKEFQQALAVDPKFALARINLAL